MPNPNDFRGSQLTGIHPTNITTPIAYGDQRQSLTTSDILPEALTADTNGIPADSTFSTDGTRHHLARPVKPQYDWIDNSNYYKTYKRQRGIEGKIQILIAHHPSPTPDQTSASIPPDPDIYASLIDLPFELPDMLLHSFHVVDNKADTLTQSQMLKDVDHKKFIDTQSPELQGLQKMDVFDIQPIAKKPPQARLLSSIWSYR